MRATSFASRATSRTSSGATVEPYLEVLLPRAWRDTDLESPDTTVVEVVLALCSMLVGKTPREVHFRACYGMNVLAVWRGGEPLLTGLPDVCLEFGDALFLQGSRERRQMLREEPDLIALPREHKPAIPEVPGKRWTALAIVGVTLAVAVAAPLLAGEVMLGGALAMVLAGVLSIDQAYQAID